MRGLQIAGIPSSPVPQLGPCTFPYRSVEPAFDGTHPVIGAGYGTLVEISGTVSPPGVPCSFYFARRILSASDHARDAHGSPLPTAPSASPDTSDTSRLDVQSIHPSATNRVYDVDCPSAAFESSSRVGDLRVMSVSFEEILAIGNPEGFSDAARANLWAHVQSGFGISRVMGWSSTVVARVTRAGALPEVQIVRDQCNVREENLSWG